MKNTITFKKYPKVTGLAAVSEPYQSVEIKHKKQQIGTIHAPHWSSKDDLWSISLKVKRDPTPKDKCPFRNAIIKEKFPNENAARQWLKDNTELLFKTFQFHYSE